IKFLPDGKTLLTYPEGTIGQFLLWNLETGNMTGVWRTLYKSFGDIKLSNFPERLDYTYAAFDLSPDGAHLATATSNGAVTLWDTMTLQQTVVQPKPEKLAQLNIRSITFSADGKTLLYYDNLSKQTHFWDVAFHEETKAIAVGSTWFALSPHNDAL